MRRARAADAQSTLVSALATLLEELRGPRAQLKDVWPVDSSVLLTTVHQRLGARSPATPAARAAEDAVSRAVLAHLQAADGTLFPDIGRLRPAGLLEFAASVAEQARRARADAVTRMQRYEETTGLASCATSASAAAALRAHPTGPSLTELLSAQGDGRPSCQGWSVIPARPRHSRGGQELHEPGADAWPWLTRAGHVCTLPLSTLAVVETLVAAAASSVLGWAQDCDRAAKQAATAADDVVVGAERLMERFRVASLEAQLARSSPEECRAAVAREQAAAAVAAEDERSAKRLAMTAPVTATELLGREITPLPSTGQALQLMLPSRSTASSDATPGGPALLAAQAALAAANAPDEALLDSVAATADLAHGAAAELSAAQRRAAELQSQVAVARAALSARSDDAASQAAASRPAASTAASADAGPTSGATSGPSAETEAQCPISLEPIREATQCELCGQAFERAAIEEWVAVARRRGGKTACPTCKQPLSLVRLAAPEGRKAQQGRELECVLVDPERAAVTALARPGDAAATAAAAAAAVAAGHAAQWGLPSTDVLNATAVEGEADGMGSKLRVLVARLKRLPEEQRALVFSQEPRVLEALSASLARAGIPAALLRGKRREQRGALELFQGYDCEDGHSCHGGPAGAGQRRRSSARPKALLLDFRHDASGLTLTAASHVFLLEPFTPEDERQALCRALRLGQSRPVHCYRVTMAGTLEERLLVERERLAHGLPPARLAAAHACELVLGRGAEVEPTAGDSLPDGRSAAVGQPARGAPAGSGPGDSAQHAGEAELGAAASGSHGNADARTLLQGAASDANHLPRLLRSDEAHRLGCLLAREALTHVAAETRADVLGRAWEPSLPADASDAERHWETAEADGAAIDGRASPPDLRPGEPTSPQRSPQRRSSGRGSRHRFGRVRKRRRSDAEPDRLTRVGNVAGEVDVERLFAEAEG